MASYIHQTGEEIGDFVSKFSPRFFSFPFFASCTLALPFWSAGPEILTAISALTFPTQRKLQVPSRLLLKLVKEYSIVS